MEKLKKFSFLIATVLIVAALAVKVTRPEWQRYANIAVIVGIVFFAVSIYFERAELKKFFTARATRYGLNSLVMIVLTLAIVSLANWVLARHAWKYDTTKSKQFSLSPLTVNSLKNLKQPVKITAFFTEAREEDLRTKMKDLLDNYKPHSKMLDVRIVDPVKNLRLTQQYDVRTNGTTVLESGKQKTTISTTDEEDLTNAILKVTSKKQPVVYFLQGHGEPSITDSENGGYSSIVDQLRKTNYDIKELKDFAGSPKVPADCSTLVIVAPRVAMLEPEIKGLKSYLDAGGRAIVLDDPQADPSLEKLLAAFGVQGEKDIVIDDQRYLPFADVSVPLIAPKSGTNVTREMNYAMFFPVTKSLTYKQPQGSSDFYTPIAESLETSWGETDKEKAQFDEGKDKKGPLTVGITVTHPVNTKDKKSNEMRMAVFGDYNFVQNGFVNIPGNTQIFLNSVAWLTEQENLIHLPPRNQKNDIMVLSSTALNAIGLATVIVLPVLILGVGITVWVKRKKL